MAEDVGGGGPLLGHSGSAALAVTETVAMAAALYFQAGEFVVVAGEGGPAGAAADVQTSGFFVGVGADFGGIHFAEAAGPIRFVALADGAIDFEVRVFDFVVPANGGGGFGTAAATGGIGGGEHFFLPGEQEAFRLFGGFATGGCGFFEVLAVPLVV